MSLMSVQIRKPLYHNAFHELLFGDFYGVCNCFLRTVKQLQLQCSVKLAAVVPDGEGFNFSCFPQEST